MEQNKEGLDGYLEKLALISEGIDELHVGKKAVVFDLNKEEFLKIRSLFKNVSADETNFKVDISGIEFIYLLNE